MSPKSHRIRHRNPTRRVTGNRTVESLEIKINIAALVLRTRLRIMCHADRWITENDRHSRTLRWCEVTIWNADCFLRVKLFLGQYKYITPVELLATIVYSSSTPRFNVQRSVIAPPEKPKFRRQVAWCVMFIILVSALIPPSITPIIYSQFLFY